MPFEGERYSAFISYSHHDLEVAEKLETAFREAKMRVWRDSVLIIGEDYFDKIASAIDASRCVVFLASRHSVKSDWVQREVFYTTNQKKPVFPVHLDDNAERYMPPGLRICLAATHHIHLHEKNRDREMTEVAQQVSELPGSFLERSVQMFRGMFPSLKSSLHPSSGSPYSLKDGHAWRTLPNGSTFTPPPESPFSPTLVRIAKP